MTRTKKGALSGLGIGTLALCYLKPPDEPWADRLLALAFIWCFVGLLVSLWWLREWARRRHDAAAFTDLARSEHQAELERRSLRVADELARESESKKR